MSVTQLVYPFVLAITNVVTGWLFYHLFDPVFGVGLAVVGILVAVSVVGGMVPAHSPPLKPSA